MLSKSEVSTVALMYAALCAGRRVATDELRKAERLIQKQMVSRSHLRVPTDETQSLRNLLSSCRELVRKERP